MAADGVLSNHTIVTTPMTNSGLEKGLKHHHITMVRAPVGERYVIEEMRKNGWNLGGEQSGHVIFLDDATTGDGILTALKILGIMKRREKPLAILKNIFELYPQSLVNVRVNRKMPLEELVELQTIIKEVESKLAGEGRVFVRHSGTEPIVRILVEGKEQQRVQEFAQLIATTVKRLNG
jgi:phosphoglucosamine mutase